MDDQLLLLIIIKAVVEVEIEIIFWIHVDLIIRI